MGNLALAVPDLRHSASSGAQAMGNRRKEDFSEDETELQGIDRVSRQQGDFWGRTLVVSFLLAAVIGSFVAAYVLG